MTNGIRIRNEETPEGRLAAAARQVVTDMRERFNREADYADFKEVFRIHLHHELRLARIDEARRNGHFDRMNELVREIDIDLERR
ncbi:MAG: hypothetical protein ACRD4S_17030 [Candidatus Acidiferrales bacterium]